jgi:serine/threonine protein kinase
VTQAPDDLVGHVVEDRYRIEAQLGSGGMGVVYRARHIKVGREVAIKVLHDHLLSDPTMVERFEREAALAARLAHRNLVSVIDVGETAAHQKLMVLELARGQTLAEIVASGGLSRERVIVVTTQLLAGLEHAHAAGLVHRDLKPENVIVEVDEHGHEIPKIVDFGVALLRGDERRLTTAGVVLGTPQYMAPEHAQGHAVDPRTDLFALGVMVYEMLGGKLPFDGTGVEVALANITQDPPPIFARTGIAVDPLLEAFARRLMARRIRDRFQCARAALDVLELLETQPAAAREILMPPPYETVTPCHRITSLGTQAPIARPTHPTVIRARGSTPPRVFAARSRSDLERLALAATLEAEGAPAPRRRRRKSKRRAEPPKPWQPWKSFGLLGGAVLAVLLLASIAITEAVTTRIPTHVVPSIPVSSPALEPLVSVRAVVYEAIETKSPATSRTTY